MAVPQPRAGLPESADVVVIGSGMGGLACGALLAVEGARVVLLEKHSKLGGYVQYFGKDPTWDSDFHFLGGFGDSASAGHLLHRLGLPQTVAFVALDPAYRCVYPDHDLRIPPADFDVANLLGELFREPGVDIAAFFKDLGRLGQAAVTPFETGSALLLEEFAGRTVSDLLDGRVENPQLRALLTSLWPLCGLPPARLSAIAFALWWNSVHGTGRAAYPLGGAKALSQGFSEVIAEHGGEVHLRTEVTRVLVDEGRAQGVEVADGRVVRAPIVVADLAPQDLYSRLVGDQWLDEEGAMRLDTWELAPSAVVAHFHVEMPLEDAAHLTLLFGDYDAEKGFGDAMEDPGRCSPLIISVPTVTDPERTAPGRHLVVAMALADYDRSGGWGSPDPESRRSPAYRSVPAYTATKEEVGRQILERCETLYPGMSDHIVAMRVATPLTMERYTYNPRGSAFGWAPTPAQSRLPPQVTPVTGLFQCGHWTAPGGGVCAALKSGEWAATEILKRTAAEE